MAEVLRAVARRLVPRAVRNLVRNPGATARWLRDEAAYRAGRVEDVTVRDGWAIRAHPASAAVFRQVARDPDQAAELAEFAAHCRPGMVFFDVGASHGLFTMAALHYGGPAARAVAVDPSASSNRLLQINLARSGVADRAQVFEAAVGAEDGDLAMVTTGPAGDHYLIAADAARPDARRIPQLSLETLAARAGLEPTHLKVDVEGFEAEVIRGGAGLLRRARPRLFLELHSALIRGRGEDPGGVLAALAALGYDRVEWRGRPVAAAEATARDLVRLVLPPPGAGS